jgi:hypothetical protein
MRYLIFVLFYFFYAEHALASNCSAKQLPYSYSTDKTKFAYDYSDIVIEGTPLYKLSTIEASEQNPDGLLVKEVIDISVKKIIKSPEKWDFPYFKATFGYLDCSCYKKFKIGETYRIYASIKRVSPERGKIYFCDEIIKLDQKPSDNSGDPP